MKEISISQIKIPLHLINYALLTCYLIKSIIAPNNTFQEASLGLVGLSNFHYF